MPYTIAEPGAFTIECPYVEIRTPVEITSTSSLYVEITTRMAPTLISGPVTYGPITYPVASSDIESTTNNYLYNDASYQVVKVKCNGLDWDSTTDGFAKRYYLKTVGSICKKLEKNIYQPWHSYADDEDYLVDTGTAWCGWGNATSTTYQTFRFAPVPPPPPGTRLRQILQARSGPLVFTRKPLSSPTQEREMRARETLRKVIGEENYRRYIKHGFFTVRAKSGLIYQLFPGNTYCWKDGKRVEHLCVVLRGDFPATDTLIVRYLMILNNEEGFRALAIKSSPCQQRQQAAVDMRPLMEIYKELKAAA